MWRGVPSVIDRHRFRVGGARRLGRASPSTSRWATGTRRTCSDEPEPALDAIEQATRPWFGGDDDSRDGRDGSHAARARPAARRARRHARRVPRGRTPRRAAGWRGELRSAARANLLPGRRLGADRPEGGVRASRALRSSGTPSRCRRSTATTCAEPFLQRGVDAHVPERRARLDLRLLRRRGVGAGARALRRGGADRRGAGAPRRRRGSPRRSRGTRRRREPVAARAHRPGRARLVVPPDWERGRRSRRRTATCSRRRSSTASSRCSGRRPLTGDRRASPARDIARPRALRPCPQRVPDR